MKKEEKKPDTQVAVRGLIGSTVLSLLLIHFWIADLAAMVLRLSREAAYLSSVTLLVLLNGWRYA
ncbi:MAG TPA: hypothetical protein VEC35_14255 [Noviherbaspirillum sp.]|nr:hypothetical protein [Noviherbaspirillum sp.]